MSEWNVVPPTLYATFPVYANISPFGFTGSLELFESYIRISIWNSAFDVNVFPVPALPVRNKCTGVCMFKSFFIAISFRIACCSRFNIRLTL
jgi:hypothetical protein